MRRPQKRRRRQQQRERARGRGARAGGGEHEGIRARPPRQQRTRQPFFGPDAAVAICAGLRVDFGILVR